MPYTRKIIKPNLNSKDLKQLQNANIQYSKKTKEHYFKYTQDIDYKLFNIALLCDEHGTSFYGSFGAKQLFFLIAKIALQAKSNKIALDRHYAHYALQIVPRTLRIQLDILEEVGLIALIKGKHRYAYIYLKDYRKLSNYQPVGLNQKANIPTPFFLAILAYSKKIVQALKEVAFKIKGRHGLFTLKSTKDNGRMCRFNDVILEFSPLDDPNTTIFITYEQLTGKQIPNYEVLLPACYCQEKSHRSFKESNGFRRSGVRKYLKACVLLCMGVLQAGGLENLQNAIQSWLSSGSAKLILTIIFIGIGIFVWKNLDRWKEILLTVLGVVLGSLVFFGAPNICLVDANFSIKENRCKLCR